MGLSDRDLLAKTLMAEAGNQGIGGMMDVGSVIMNRANTTGYGNGVRGVIMKPGQFSAWNGTTGYAGGEQGQNMAAMQPSAEIYKAADMLLSGNYNDQTGGATHYYNDAISQPKWGASAGGNWQRRGDHVFGFADAGRRGTSPQPTIGSQAMQVLGKTLPKQQQRGILATPQKGPEPMQKQQPRGLLGSMGIQKMQEGAEGETGQRFYQRDSFKDTAAKMGQAFAALGSNPAVQKFTSDVADQRTETKSRNKTVEYLRANGMGNMADMVEAGDMSAGGVMSAIFKNRLAVPSATSGIMMGENLVNPKTGETIRAGAPKGVDYEMRQKLRKEVFGLPAIKDYQTQGVAYAKIVSAASDPSPAGDLAMVFSFMKVLDPGSTVREGEFAQVAKAGKLDSRVQSYASQVLSGQGLTPDQRADFVRRAEMLYRGSEEQLSATFDQYGRIAQQQGFDPADVIPQFGFKGSSVPAPVSNVKPASYTGTQAGWDAMSPADRKLFQ